MIERSSTQSICYPIAQKDSLKYTLPGWKKKRDMTPSVDGMSKHTKEVSSMQTGDFIHYAHISVKLLVVDECLPIWWRHHTTWHFLSEQNIVRNSKWLFPAKKPIAQWLREDIFQLLTVIRLLNDRKCNSRLDYVGLFLSLISQDGEWLLLVLLECCWVFLFHCNESTVFKFLNVGAFNQLPNFNDINY